MSKKPCSISFKPAGKNKPCTTVINGGLKVKKNIDAQCDLTVKKCLNVKNIVYSNTETITESGQTVSGVKSLSWINTNGQGELSDNTKDGFYKKVIYIGSYSQTSVIFDEGGTTGTFIIPDGVTSIIVEAYGAGAGGAFGENFEGYSGGDTKWDTIISGGGKGAEGFDNIGVGGTIDGTVDSFENGQSGDENGNGGNGGGPLGGSGGTGSILFASNGQTYGGGGGGGDIAYGSGGGAYFLKTYDVKASDLFDYEIGKGGTSEDSSNGTTGADGAIILTYNALITEPYTLEYNGGETTVLTDVGDNACFIYNDELNKWIKLI